MDFIRNWGHISCHFLLELHPWPVFSIHVRMAKLFIRHKLHLSDNTVAKHVEMLQRFSLTFSGIFWMKAVCTADVRKLGVVSDMLIQLQESTWYEKKLIL